MWVQEFCNGGSLRAAIDRGFFRTHHLPQRWSPIIAVLKHICTGMAYMHGKKVLHGDLNPSNVLLQVPPSHACMLTQRPASCVLVHACTDCERCILSPPIAAGAEQGFMQLCQYTA